MKFEKAFNKLSKVKTPKGYMSCLRIEGKYYLLDKDKPTMTFTEVFKGKLTNNQITLPKLMEIAGNSEVTINNIKVNNRSW